MSFASSLKVRVRIQFSTAHTCLLIRITSITTLRWIMHSLIGTSSEMYKGIMYDKSTGVFNGKIYVRLDAQRQQLSAEFKYCCIKGATINTKPELEIYADDVKCSHGCTVGQFDEEAMFYLNARGIDDESAKSLLVQAYIGDVLNSVTFEEIKNEVVRLYSERHGWL